MEIYLSPELKHRALAGARELSESGGDVFVIEKIGHDEGGSKFYVQRSDDGLLVLDTITIGDQRFYLGCHT